MNSRSPTPIATGRPPFLGLAAVNCAYIGASSLLAFSISLVYSPFVLQPNSPG